jgi:hypothetical protein
LFNFLLITVLPVLFGLGFLVAFIAVGVFVVFVFSSVFQFGDSQVVLDGVGDRLVVQDLRDFQISVHVVLDLVGLNKGN